MKKGIKKVIVMILTVVMVMLCAVPVFAAGTRGRNTVTVKNGCTIVNVKGNFETPNKTALLKRINAIRYEACTAGNVPNPSNPKKMLTKADYVPVKWSTELEKMAQLRAAEVSVLFSHSRPNGDTSPWSAAYKVTSYAENISSANMAMSIDMYYWEKAYYIQTKQRSAWTGHYVSMIDPGVTHIGTAAFTDSHGSRGSAMEFTYGGKGYREAKTGEYGEYTQRVEMKNSLVKKYSPNTRLAVAVKSVSLNKKTASIMAGKTFTLKATIKPGNATYKNVTWTSSNKSIATVSKGKVTAKKAGKVTITVKTSNGKKASCKVTVKPKPVAVTGVSLNKKTASVTVGGTLTLKATIKPANATNKTVTWTSSNKNIATVSNGKVTAKKVGTATITVKSANGKKASCKVTINPKTVEVTGVELDKTVAYATEGETISIAATVSPSNATNKTVTWTSSDTSVATVSDGRVTAKKKGSTTIIATTANGLSAFCDIVVREEGDIEVEEVVLDKTELIATPEMLEMTPEQQ